MKQELCTVPSCTHSSIQERQPPHVGGSPRPHTRSHRTGAHMGLHEPTTRGRGRKQRNKGRYLLMKWNQSFWSGCCCHVLRGRAGARSRRVHCRDCLSLENPRGSPECLGAAPCTLGAGLHPHTVVRTQDEERTFRGTESVLQCGWIVLQVGSARPAR